MKEEKALYTKIAKISGIKWIRIENEALPGIPDLLGVINGKYFLCELKMVISNRVYFRPAQYSFNKSMVALGAPTLLIFQNGKSIFVDTFKNIFNNWTYVDTMDKYIIYSFDNTHVLNPLGVSEKSRYKAIEACLQENYSGQFF